MNPADGFRFVESPPFAQVNDLMRRTWSRPCWNYDEGLLALHVMKPSGDPTLAIGQVEESTGRLASFQAYMPFDVEYLGNPYRSVFASFLTVSSDFQGKGLAGPQQGRLIERAMEAGFDLYLTMCEVGAASNRSVEKIFGQFGIQVTNVKVIRYRGTTSSLVERDVPATPSGRTRPYRHEDAEQALPLVHNAGRAVPLRKVIPKIDIDFLFLERPHAKSFVYETGGRVRGLVNVLVLEVLDEDDSKTNVYFDNVMFGDLDPSEQQEFLGDVLAALREVDYDLAFMPNIGYTSMEPFGKYHFRIMPRALNVLAAPLKKDVVPGGIVPVESLYLDVY